MSIFESILPNNSTAFEKNLEQAANFPNLPIHELSNLVNPWKIDARYLPWLAYRFAIEIWQEGWSEEKKRSVIVRALELQRIKGTERGLREYVKLVDAQVKQIIVPPQRFWISKGLTPQEIDAWHETMPQIRIYHVNRRMSAKGSSFFKHSFLKASFACPKIGRALYGRHAILWDGGQETALNMIELHQTNRRGQVVQSERVSISGMAGKSACSGRPLGTGFYKAAIKSPQIITWNADISYLRPQAHFSTTTLSPSLRPLDVRAKRQSEIWQDKYSAVSTHSRPRTSRDRLLMGRFFNNSFLMPNRAGNKLYDCLVLHDRARAAPKRQGLSFLNVNRLGMRPFRAEALIDLTLKRHPRTSFTGTGILGYHVLVPDDAKKRNGVARAVVLSKAVRDEVFVSYQTSRFINFADQPSFDGKLKFNSRMNNRL